MSKMIKILRGAIKIGEEMAATNIEMAKYPWKQDNKATIQKLDSRIHKLMRNETEMFSKNEIAQITCEAKRSTLERKELIETGFERKYRPANAQIDKTAVINLTKTPLPEDVEMVLSWGPKFVFPSSKLDLPMVITELDTIMANKLEPLFYEQAVKLTAIQLRKYQKKKNITDREIWLNFIHKRTQEFKEHFGHIIFIKSDKGKHMVAMEKEEYEAKMSEMLGDKNTYQITEDIRETNIKKNNQLVDELEKSGYIKEKFKYMDHTAMTAKIYGLPKIHKPNTPLRPITSTTNAPGSKLAKKIAKDLAELYEHESIHLRNSVECKNFVDQIALEEDEILVSYDVVSMFTNISIDLAIEIIRKKETLIIKKLGINFPLLERILRFLLVECAIFTYRGIVYKQAKSLAMGSALSPLLAKIVMTDLMETQLAKLERPPKFIKVYVDDTIGAINLEGATRMLEILNKYHNDIKFTMELEGKNGINFLDISLSRKNRKIHTNWHKKTFASDRILNYFSHHEHKTILATAIAHVKTVLRLSDASEFNNNRTSVTHRLRLNNFPETLIMAILNEHYTLMRPTSKNQVVYPWYCDHPTMRILVDHSEPEKMVDSAKEMIVKASALSNANTEQTIMDHTHNKLMEAGLSAQFANKLMKNNFRTRTEKTKTDNITYCAIPSVRGLSHHLKHIYRDFNQNLRLAGRPIRKGPICSTIKDRNDKMDQTNALVHINCNCTAESILRQTNFQERARETVERLTQEYDFSEKHCNNNKHILNTENVRIFKGSTNYTKTKRMGECITISKKMKLINKTEWHPPHKRYKQLLIEDRT